MAVDLERGMIVFVVMMEVFVLHLLLDHDRLVHLLLHDLLLLNHRRLVVVVHRFHFRVHMLLLLHFDRYVNDDFPPFAVVRGGVAGIRVCRGKGKDNGKREQFDFVSVPCNVRCVCVCVCVTGCLISAPSDCSPRWRWFEKIRPFCLPGSGRFDEQEQKHECR